MKTITSVAVSALAGMLALAQPQLAHADQPYVAAAAPSRTVYGTRVPVGTRLVVSMDQTVSTRRSYAGQGFTATNLTAVRDEQGRTVIPVGAKIGGMVHIAERGHGYHGAAVLSLGVHDLRIGGTVLPLSGHVASAEATAYRTGMRPRSQARINAGAHMIVELGQSLAVKDLLGAAQGSAIGGGPSY